MCRLNKTNIFLCLAAVLGLFAFCAESGAFQYEARGRRDPFVPLVGVAETSSISGARGILTVEDVFLQGILMDDYGKRSVIINGEIFKEGDRIERLYIESIGDNIVVIKIDEDKFELKLYE
ncbi:MAG: general secretion pathway protein GspB [Candidatus Omnitrophota bacterium]